jgi:4-hydroxy-tetrahydrodipicolinate synthase
MGNANDIEGLGIALATPFKVDGSVDFAAFGGLMDFVAGDGSLESGGADFLVVLGSTGEGATIEAEERRELVSQAVKAYGRDAKGRRLPIIVGTGSNSTAQAVRLTAEAAALGADGVLVVVPYYNKPTADGLVAHYREVAAAAKGLPLIVYNVPGRTGLNLSPQTLQRLWEIPGVAAVKESSGNLAQIGEIARTLPAGKTLLSGDDALALPAIALGAEGLISVAGNVYPRRVKALVAAVRRGERRRAAAIHSALLPFMDALFLESNPIPLKAALARADICSDTMRLPLVSASESTRARLASSMTAIEASKEGL